MEVITLGFPVEEPAFPVFKCGRKSLALNLKISCLITCCIKNEKVLTVKTAVLYAEKTTPS